MHSSLACTLTSLALTQTLALTTLVSAQQQTRDESRPRRVQPVWTQPDIKPAITSAEDNAEIGHEPTIRVALATDTRSAIISTGGRLLNATGSATTMVALDTSRVRIEPRLLSPSSARDREQPYRLMVAGAASRDEAEASAREIKKVVGEESQITYDVVTQTWGLLVGPRRSQEEAEEVLARLESAGIEASVSNLTLGSSPKSPSAMADSGQAAGPSPQASPSVRLTARTSLPSREVVASGLNANLFSSSAPVTFASDSVTTPIRFNNRPYRGRIEVFANLRGTLTVVNELGLEDYVRGVVANELSPGGYPAIEALKAQAIAARTYALRNRGQFMSQGFDLLPTTRSQVYRGLTSENPLATRAVDETRGMVATYNGEPINALYTSTCGGRTEDSENIFIDPVPYLRGRECAAEGKAAFGPFTITTSRDPANLHEEKFLSLARDVALLTVENIATFREPLTDSWLAADATISEVHSWLASVALLAGRVAPELTDNVNRPPAFASQLSAAVFGESRAGVLLNNTDANYFLAVSDAADVPLQYRADLALLVREGYLSVYPDATLRPREPLSRARVLHCIARLLEARNLLRIQKATARPATAGQLILRSTKGKDQPTGVSPNAFLFRQVGDTLYAVRSVVLIGGEPVMFHLNTNGEVDYLEVRPSPNGAAADRFSPFTNWTANLSPGQVQARLGRYAGGIGSIIDLRVVARGFSRRVTDLEIVGTGGTAHVRGGRIRSALGLREQLFTIDRNYDESGRLMGFTFTGRGWGHGVGMCQVGAYGLAREGWTSEQILKAYYTGIEVTRLY